jgi:hypothetical protein
LIQNRAVDGPALDCAAECPVEHPVDVRHALGRQAAVVPPSTPGFLSVATIPAVLFTSLRNKTVTAEPISREAISIVPPKRAHAAGLATERITAHSLRVGHATSAAVAGVALDQIAAQTLEYTSSRDSASSHVVVREDLAGLGRSVLQSRVRIAEAMVEWAQAARNSAATGVNFSWNWKIPPWPELG